MRTMIIKSNYKAGSDKKTKLLATNLIAKIDAEISSGNFQEAERLIAAGTTTPNQPFRIEFQEQIEATA